MPGFSDKVCEQLNCAHAHIAPVCHPQPPSPAAGGAGEGYAAVLSGGHELHKLSPLFCAISEEEAEALRGMFSGGSQESAAPAAAAAASTSTGGGAGK